MVRRHLRVMVEEKLEGSGIPLMDLKSVMLEDKHQFEVCAFEKKQVLLFSVGFYESLGAARDQPFCDPNASYIPCECKVHQIAQLLLQSNSSS